MLSPASPRGPLFLLKPIHLKKKEERRVQRGHPWIFSNEISDPLSSFAAGELVDVLDHASRFIGRGYINPHALIAIRIISRHQDQIDLRFFRTRIAAAREIRVRLGFGDSFRALFSEGDGIPGLIVDKYADTLVVQSLTAGIEALLEVIVTALREEYAPAVIVFKNDSAARELEGLPRETRVALGSLDGPVHFEESGITYRIDVLEGQKTGFFFDQRENRQALKGLVGGRRVLDCFCYVGAWSLTAARFGAAEVTGLDSSQRAVDLAVQNANLNGLPARFITADVFEELRKRDKNKERFGCIILDPPAFVKSRAKVREALRGYKEINLRALRLLQPGGLLVTCSCSHHIDADLFREMLIDAAHDAGRQTSLLEMRSQARDHPSQIAARENIYLKCAYLIAQ